MFAMLSIPPSGPCHAPGRRFLRVDPARHGGCHGAVVIALFPGRDPVASTWSPFYPMAADVSIGHHDIVMSANDSHPQ